MTGKARRDLYPTGRECEAENGESFAWQAVRLKNVDGSEHPIRKGIPDRSGSLKRGCGRVILDCKTIDACIKDLTHKMSGCAGWSARLLAIAGFQNCGRAKY
jgi:hypothetical protein